MSELDKEKLEKVTGGVDEGDSPETECLSIGGVKLTKEQMHTRLCDLEDEFPVLTNNKMLLKRVGFWEKTPQALVDQFTFDTVQALINNYVK